MKNITLILIALLLFGGVAFGSELSILQAEHSTIDTEVGVIQIGVALTHALADGSLGQARVTQCTTVDGGVAPWTQGTDYAVFAITGTCLVKIVGTVIDVITESNGDETISLGTTGIVANIMSAEATPATDWGAVGAPVIADENGWLVLKDTEIDIQVVGTTSIDDGILRFYALWYPLDDLNTSIVDSTTWD